MKAAVITRFGPPEVLEIREVATPVPGAHDVLVRVHASALNRADLLQRIGKYPAPPDAPADIPGIEFAGEVAATGSDATRWHAGDRVFGLIGGGAHAEYVTVHEATIARVPDNLSWNEAAAIPEAFITAYDALVTQAALAAGERVLIHAVSSGVGLAAVQIVRSWGGVPYGTSRTADKLRIAFDAGMKAGITLSDGVAPLGGAVSEWTGGRGMDVILDLVGGAYLPASIDAASLKGRIMLVGAVGGAEATVDVRRILGKRLTLRGTVLRSRPLAEKIAVTEAFVRDVLPRLASGKLQANIDVVFPLQRLGDAHERVESNRSAGKVVIELPIA
ncbi:MAG: NAD(P)H-quinone oxidoreductase [Gemmatimonadaceae bacterium]